jgi:hypothetical protein
MANTYTLIEAQTLGSNTSSIVLGSGGTIPQTYTDLLVVVSARSLRTEREDSVLFRYNGDSATNYRTANLSAFMTFLESTVNTTRDHARAESCITAANATSNMFGNLDIYIPNYRSSVSKMSYAHGGAEHNGTETGRSIYGSKWLGTGAITYITLTTASGTNFITNSTFYLYGISNA